MKRSEKEQLVAELKDETRERHGALLHGLHRAEREADDGTASPLRKANVEYVVIKNTLALRAVNESGLVGERLRGPTGLVVTKDPVGAAKIITDFAKENDSAAGGEGRRVRRQADRQSPSHEVGLDAVARADARRARRRHAVPDGDVRRRA